MSCRAVLWAVQRAMPGAVRAGTQAPLHTAARLSAKSKDRGNKKSRSGPVQVDAARMAELVEVERLQAACGRAVDKMKEEFARNLSVRSAAGAVDELRVKFDGREYELQELAQIVRKNPATVVVNFASFPQAIPDALKAIRASGLNLNPQQDGTTLFVPVPKVTKEHREALAKNAKIVFIKCRDSIKEVQNEFIKKTKKPGVSEDTIRSVQAQITALCEKYQMETRQLYMSKHNELLGKNTK